MNATRWSLALLVATSLLALAAFAWTFLGTGIVALVLIPVLLVVVVLSLDSAISSGTTIALLGVLTAVGVVLRAASPGFGGFELVFALVILAGCAFGVRFGFLLGITIMVTSSLVWGGIGPWTPFQAFGLAWVGAGAGLIGRIRTRTSWGQITVLSVFAVLASYLFGLLMNLWFWPIAVGTDTAISYVPGAPLGENLARFFGYSLVTSTLTWDSVRAVTSVAGLVLAGSAVLTALGRAPIARPFTSLARRRSTLPADGERRTHPSTVPDVTEVPLRAARPPAQA